MNQQKTKSLEEQLYEDCSFNKIEYIGKDRIFGSVNTVEIVTPSVSQYSLRRLHAIGWDIDNISGTSDGKIRIIIDRCTGFACI